MKSPIKVVIKEPGKLPYYDEIPNELEILQKTVDGYIETVTLASDLVVICNEEGRLLANAANCTISGVSFVGTIILAGIDGEEFGDLPEALQDQATLCLLFPTLFTTAQSSSERACPICGMRYTDPPAISRKTGWEICPDCGLNEAISEYLGAFGVKEVV